MSNLPIDINADLGEGIGNDKKIMPLISSCNIASGGHAGNERSIRKSIVLAKKHNLKIGAHPAFPDPDNFGRKMLDISPKILLQSLEDQLSTFQKIADEEAVQIHHLKPHGALYNQGVNHPSYAEVMLEVFGNMKSRPRLYLPRESLLNQLANQYFEIDFEAFIDRAYTDGRSLLSRKEKGAIIDQPQLAWSQLEQLYKNHQVKDIHGRTFPLKADTFCIHGDQKNAVAILQYIHEKLKIDE